MTRTFSPDLDALSALAASFARAYPALAPRLAERSADPDVERLLDAFAYLTEQIHHVLDAGSPAAAQFFADMLAPELSRPFPAATILEFAPPRHGGRITVPSGAEVSSIPVDGTPCRFRAWSAFDVVPWSIEDARIVWSAAEGQSLDLTLLASNTFASPNGLLESLFPLRLHFGGDSRAALTLLLYLRTHLTEIEIQVGGAEGTKRSLGKSVRPWGLHRDQALLPSEPFEHPGLRLLREYFVLPAKFAFVELGWALPTFDEPMPVASRVHLRLRFDTQLPGAMQLTGENIRLNCVPVANVFETTTDPVRPTLERTVQPLRPAGLPLGHGDTYSVTRVLARLAGGTGMVPVAPFSDFEAAPEEALDDVFYVARPVATPFGGGSEIHLSLGSPAGSPPVPEVEFLSVEIRATNGTLPGALGVGDVCTWTEGSPPGLAFRNISAVTPHRPPAAGDDLRWRTLAVTALSALPLTSARTLQTLLHVLDLHPLGDAQSARAHAQKLQAILGVTVETGRARHPSPGGEPHEAIVVGHDVRIDVSNSGFDGEGGALVFASVLASLFGHEASLGSFVRTTVRMTETGRVFTFPALHGDTTFAPAKQGF